MISCTGNKGFSPITILMPCIDQKKEFLIDALNSVVTQTDPSWRLLVILYRETPEEIREIMENYRADSRRRVIFTDSEQDAGLAGPLNAGMNAADTRFVTVLFTDDFFHRKTIAVLHRYITRFPEVDFFHSSRVFTDARGRVRSKVLRSREIFSLEDFSQNGSPVKHLLCWRRSKGLEIGGMREEFGLHGCDDFDFTWRMAEAGYTFKAIREAALLLHAGEWKPPSTLSPDSSAPGIGHDESES